MRDSILAGAKVEFGGREIEYFFTFIDSDVYMDRFLHLRMNLLKKFIIEDSLVHIVE